MSAAQVNARVTAVGGVFDLSSEIPRCLGSCTAIGRVGLFLTAAHVLRGRDASRLAVNSNGSGSRTFSPAKLIAVEPAFDIALLEVELEKPQWVLPFMRLSAGVYYGTDVSALGWPMDLVSATAGKETLRCLRGFVQRVLAFENRAGARYAAFELSFGTPPGMSGAPVFFTSDPGTLIGIVTENFQSYTVIESTYEVIPETGASERHEASSIITYGIANRAWDARETWIDHLASVELVSPPPG